MREIVSLLNRYFSLQVKAFFSACGTLDKYIDDAIMAFWRGGISRSMLNAPQRAQRKYDAPTRTQRGVSMKRFVVLTFIFLCTVLSAAHAKETGSTRMDVDLMAGPYSDAKAAGKLPQNTAVSVLERRGGWLRISAKNKSGWVKLHQVRLGEGTQAKNSGGGLAVLKSVGQTGRSGSTGIVATTGIRGLSAEELKAAKPNPQAVEAMEASRANEASARAFASSAKLKEQTVPFLSKE